MLRVAQEALANVAKHADAVRVGVTLSYMGDIVTSTSRTTEPASSPAVPNEWRRSRPRVRAHRDARSGWSALAGTLEVESEPGGGHRGLRHASPRSRSAHRMSDDRPIRLLIVDDHPVVRDGLRGMFDGDDRLRGGRRGGDGAEAIAVAGALDPDVVLMDLRMPEMDGVAAIRRADRPGSPARVLVLTTFDTDSDVLPAIEAGATGYLLKDAPRDELLRAVRAAAAGEAVLSPAVAARLHGPGPPARQGDRSASASWRCFSWSRGAATNREAAERLFISEATVKTHLLHIYAKLGVNDRAAAVGAAFEKGLLTPGEGR